MSQWFAERCSCVIGFHKVTSSSNFTPSQAVPLVGAALFLLFLQSPFPPLMDWAAYEKDIRIMKSKCPFKIHDGVSHRSNSQKPIPRLPENAQRID